MNTPCMLPEVRGGFKVEFTNATDKTDSWMLPLVQSGLNNPFTKVTYKANYYMNTHYMLSVMQLGLITFHILPFRQLGLNNPLKSYCKKKN